MKEENGKSKFKKMIKFLIIFLIIVISVLFYSKNIEIYNYKVNEYRILNDKFSSIHGLKIMHISDIHYGRTINYKDLEKIVDKINLSKPDIVVLTGDLIDKDTVMDSKISDELSTLLNKIDASIVKYAISGEDDLSFDNWSLILENSGFVNLNNNYDAIYFNDTDYILFTGLSSNYNDSNLLDEKLEKTNTFINSNLEHLPMYSILLMHEPDFIDDINLDNFDLIMAGHNHNGQIRLPLIGGLMRAKYGTKYPNSYYQLDNTVMYVSAGLGCNNNDYRLFNRPSMNLYRLVSY